MLFLFFLYICLYVMTILLLENQWPLKRTVEKMCFLLKTYSKQNYRRNLKESLHSMVFYPDTKILKKSIRLSRTSVLERHSSPGEIFAEMKQNHAIKYSIRCKKSIWIICIWKLQGLTLLLKKINIAKKYWKIYLEPDMRSRWKSHFFYFLVNKIFSSPCHYNNTLQFKTRNNKEFHIYMYIYKPVTKTILIKWE